MTDFEVTNQFTDTIALFFIGFSCGATVVFAYIAGAFFFLHKAPWVTRVITYLFFVCSMLFLTINLFGTYLHFLSVIDQLEVSAGRPDASTLVKLTYDDFIRPLASAGFWTFLATIIGILMMTFWMTFIWRPQPDATAP